MDHRMPRLAQVLAPLLAAIFLAGAATTATSQDWVAFRMAPTNNVVIDGPLRTQWKVVTGGPISASPSISGSTLYVGNNHGTLDAIDVRSGNLVWSRHLSNALMSAPLLYKGLVI